MQILKSHSVLRNTANYLLAQQQLDTFCNNRAKVI